MRDARPREVAETVEIAAPLVDTLSLCRLTVLDAVGWLTYIGLLRSNAAAASPTHTVMPVCVCVCVRTCLEIGGMGVGWGGASNQATHAVSTAELSHLCC